LKGLTAGRLSSKLFVIPFWKKTRVRMKRRLRILCVVGFILIAGAFFYLDDQTDHRFTSVLHFQPTYEGQTLQYWLEHWYQQNGQNSEAAEAVRAMGTNALPYLVKWITQPADYNWVGRALAGFEALGPVASPAIPDLVKGIGRNGSFVAGALGAIGTNAIPALTNRLLESVSVSNAWAKTRPRFGSRHPPEEWIVQMSILQALRFYDTNARPAVPALIAYLKHPNALAPWDAVGVLALAGHNQPEVVFPVLFQTFSNTTSNVRTSIADALASFGTNALSAVPVLLSGQQDKDANARAHIAVAIKRIAPQTPHALDPVIQNLEHENERQQTLYLLGTMGTDGMEALPALLKCLDDPDAQVRAGALVILHNLERRIPQAIPKLRELSKNDPDANVRGRAADVLQLQLQ
jgi:HEAT repeat protein